MRFEYLNFGEIRESLKEVSAHGVALLFASLIRWRRRGGGGGPGRLGGLFVVVFPADKGSATNRHFWFSPRDTSALSYSRPPTTRNKWKTHKTKRNAASFFISTLFSSFSTWFSTQFSSKNEATADREEKIDILLRWSNANELLSVGETKLGRPRPFPQ